VSKSVAHVYMVSWFKGTMTTYPWPWMDLPAFTVHDCTCTLCVHTYGPTSLTAIAAGTGEPLPADSAVRCCDFQAALGGVTRGHLAVVIWNTLPTSCALESSAC
jgi:hypothetical protein